MQRLRLEAGVVESAKRMNSVRSLAEVVKMCETPWGLQGYSPLLEHNYLLLDVASIENQAGSVEWAALASRLRLLPCPVIAVGKVTARELLRGVDVVVDSVQEATALIRNIDQHPLAAMTLVQVLRHNEDVGPAQGLLVESLAYASLQGGAEFAQVKKAIHSVRQPSIVAQDAGSPVVVERRHNELHIALNRPHARNAYSIAMRDSLYEALQLLKMDTDLSGAVINGEGSCFCIGGDLAEFGTAPDTATAHAIRCSRSVAQLLLELGAKLQFRLHRACIGSGVELPAFGARVVAQRNTFMQLPEIKLGLLPGAGGTVSILRRIGRHRMAYMALSARRISAETALRWGLIDAIV